MKIKLFCERMYFLTTRYAMLTQNLIIQQNVTVSLKFRRLKKRRESLLINESVSSLLHVNKCLSSKYVQICSYLTRTSDTSDTQQDQSLNIHLTGKTTLTTTAMFVFYETKTVSLQPPKTSIAQHMYLMTLWHILSGVVDTGKKKN